MLLQVNMRRELQLMVVEDGRWEAFPVRFVSRRFLLQRLALRRMFSHRAELVQVVEQLVGDRTESWALTHCARQSGSCRPMVSARKPGERLVTKIKINYCAPTEFEIPLVQN